MNHPPGTAYERLLAAAAQLKVPEAVRTVATATPSDPEPGQIWRAAWGTVSELLAVTAVGDDAVHVIPVSMEAFHDEKTLILPGSASTLEVPLALWCGLKGTVPWCVLDRQMGELTIPLPVDGYLTNPDALPAGRWGAPAPSTAAQPVEYRGSVADAINELSSAHWVPEGTGRLGQLFREHHVTTAQLADHLDVPPARALALWRGLAPLTHEQAQRLAELLHLPPSTLLAANPAVPPPVIRALGRPLRRRQLRHLAEEEDESEDEVRRRAAFDVFALAARQPGGRNTDWEARVERYFQVRLGEDHHG
ncbi:hypothetical protein HY68_36215 [Streptomyces sp. AcH 505]|uniref:hypothetical protein n=1 Tax=Streptomyces sp. AcH 505 TaxID=352211 RepID=UPI0005918E03|nr:hypothetical protein HY68_36215 [Streptomyces sp. AcH 505]